VKRKSKPQDFGERNFIELENILRQQIAIEKDPQRLHDLRRGLSLLLKGWHDMEERLKHSDTTWGGAYGYLPSGVIDYLPDDFRDRFSFDDYKDKSDE
jgi:hypothetical protein